MYRTASCRIDAYVVSLDMLSSRCSCKTLGHNDSKTINLVASPKVSLDLSWYCNNARSHFSNSKTNVLVVALLGCRTFRRSRRLACGFVGS
jgi:hypothetical protein